MKIVKTLAYVVFCVALGAACYLRPVPDDFDRYIYETLIRSAKQPVTEIYRVVKHESARAEASSVMDSPEHLAQLEPLYAIRPLYIELTRLVSLSVPPQAAINLVSALSLTLCSVVIAIATRSKLYSALLLSSPGILMVGRLGTPDALSSLAVVTGCIAMAKNKLFPGVLLLMISVWIRTDNALFVLAVLVWLAWNKKLKVLHAAVLSGVAVASVEWINTLSGNYGWQVLFQYSFIGGKYPAEILPHITLAAYVKVVLENAVVLAPQLAPWLLLALVAWVLKSPERKFLVPVAVACILHYLLFPSAEARYFVWAYLLTGIIFIRGLSNLETIELPDIKAQARASVA